MHSLSEVRAAAGIEIAAARLDVDGRTVATLVNCLSQAERGRARACSRERDRRRFIVARARCRELLAERLRDRPEALELTRGAHGKPALGGRHAATGLRFNVSHCEDLALYALAWGREVGVDVEAIRAFPEADDIAARCFSRQERAAYFALDDAQRPRAFYECWTRKEAFAKALGVGLSMPLDALDVSSPPGGWRLESFTPRPGFIAAVAARCD